jgi:hypothetical protein
MSSMYRYSGYGLGIDSELELPELPPGDGEPDVVIRLGAVPQSSRQPTVDEEFAFNTLAGAFRITGGKEITVDPLPDAAPGALNVVLLGRIMAFLLRQRGWLPLHASVVVVNERAILFLGPSGGGKSTTAAAFHARGHMVIADDVGAVRVLNGHSVVRPAWSRIRLLDDSRELLAGLELPSEFHFDKHSYQLSAARAHRLFPVGRIYHLEFGEELRTEALAPLVAVAQLSRQSFTRHRKQGAEAMSIHLRDCASVASVTPVYRLERPRSLNGLSELVGLVEKHVD